MTRYLAVVLTLAAAGAFAQRPRDMPLTPATRAEIIEAVADRIDRYYVDPEKAKTIAAALRAAATSGAFTEAHTALALNGPVNKVLQEASKDRHLRFGYDAVPSTRPDDAPETPEERAANLREARENAFGIHGVQRLDGNIGLLTWMKFHEPELAGEAVATAMRLLESTDALIIDLRNSEGGSPDMVILLLSYFVPKGEPLLVSIVYNRYKNTTQQRWTLPWVPGGPYGERDIYILTSKRTWSAGEGFTEHMRRLAHATVVGETTRGGGHMSKWMRVHPNFAISVPVARDTGEVGMTSWERTGVKPDVEAAEANALRTAHLLALRKLLERATDAGAKESLADAIARVEAP